MLFQEKYDLLKSKNILLDPRIRKIKLSEINNKMAGTSSLFCWLNVIQPMRFIAEIKHPETIELIKKYSTTNIEVSKIYKHKNFLDVIISKLNE